jgi:hypothetical protein
VVHNREDEDDGASDSLEEEEGAKPKGSDNEWISSLKKVENDMDDHETRGSEGLSSMDVVDKTMSVDISQNEDEPWKLPNDMLHAAASVGSLTFPWANDINLTSHNKLLLDSLLDAASSSSIVAVMESSPLHISAVQKEVLCTAVGDLPLLAFNLEHIMNAWTIGGVPLMLLQLAFVALVENKIK